MNTEQKAMMMKLCRSELEWMIPSEEERQTLREAYKVAKRNKMASKKGFVWRDSVAGVLRVKSVAGQVVIKRNLNRRIISKYQRLQLVNRETPTLED